MSVVVVVAVIVSWQLQRDLAPRNAAAQSRLRQSKLKRAHTAAVSAIRVARVIYFDDYAAYE